ncbi:GGDEF domain-containing protein [Vampirovibrio sp.]|uniref:GGDEF domain-containing protein n=1 Tax=Vampirovibrio sp. TaxID=2717857 RepID=UPI00359395D0
MSMTFIYVLSNQPTPLAFRVAEAVGERYPVQAIQTERELLEKLPDSRQAIVFVDCEIGQIAPFTVLCRSVLPAATVVAVLPDATPIAEVPVLDMDCHLLPVGFSDFDLLSRVASAIRQSELLAVMADSAPLDEVTNLHNRAFFMQRLGEEISLARRHAGPLCCVVLSLDGYRMYLDSYGYHFMNALLRFVGDAISGMTRHEDTVARLGDDEIAILLPRSSEAGAKVFTTRLVETLNALVFNNGAYSEDIMVSAGLVGYPLPDSVNPDADTLVRYGRHALYQAKADDDEALNKVCVFSEIKPAL